MKPRSKVKNLYSRLRYKQVCENGKFSKGFRQLKKLVLKFLLFKRIINQKKKNWSYINEKENHFTTGTIMHELVKSGQAFSVVFS